MKSLKIALIGGTGKSGQYVLNELLKRGYQVQLLHRHPENLSLSHPLLKIVTGDARDYKGILNVLEECEVVVSTLGQPKGEPSIFSTATSNILKAMKEHTIQRYIVTTGISVETSNDRKNAKIAGATQWMYSNYPETTKDKQLEYNLLKESNVDWTIIRLPLIEITNQSYQTVVNLTDCEGESISATDLATFIVDQIEEQKYIHEAPFFSNKRD